MEHHVPPSRVELQYFDGCPGWMPAHERLRTLAGELGFVLELRRIVYADTMPAGFRGSPTILVDGQDPFGSDDLPVGLSCRVYDTPEGLAGSPTIEQLRAALETRQAVR